VELRLLRGKALGIGGILGSMSLLQSDMVKPSAPRNTQGDELPVYPPGPHKFTVEEYDALGQLNLPEGKTELVHGVIFHMPPAGNAHAYALELLRNRLFAYFPEPWFIRTQSTHRFSKYLAREPDIAVLTAAPIPGATLDEVPTLIVEISDATLSYDLGPKRLDYANHHVPEYWIVDIKRKVVHVFRGPVTSATEAELAYATQTIVDINGVLSPLAAPSAQIKVADFMPKAAAT
jgi:Uma2 family endonuclease